MPQNLADLEEVAESKAKYWLLLHELGWGQQRKSEPNSASSSKPDIADACSRQRLQRQLPLGFGPIDNFKRHAAPQHLGFQISGVLVPA